MDRGGTFTDVVAYAPDGKLRTVKLLSSSPLYADPSVEGIRRALGLASGEPLPEEEIESIRFGTTAATNALLERRGGNTLLLITRGFVDLLEIGSQARPDIFSLCVEKPLPLYSSVVEVDERTGPDGKVERELDLTRLEFAIKALDREFDSVAVVLLHSWKNPTHELECEKLLQGLGYRDVHLSHRSVNLIKATTRGQSTVVDSYLGPVMEEYFQGIRKDVGGIPVRFIQSSGSLVAPERFKGKSAVFSGPAGGVVAASRVAEEAGLKGVIGFDMGGTSTDVTRYEGRLDKLHEQVVAGIELQGETLFIETVASGGGSLLWFDQGRMRVGPQSAGALPGPACYGLGGGLTVTDANLLAGRISPGDFPHTFGPGRDSILDVRTTREKFDQLTGEINRATGRGLTPVEAALGFLDIANSRMALAIKRISVSKGFDVRDYALVSFGGAGGQHAATVARMLGMRSVVYHPLSSLLSAYGIALASSAETGERTVLVEYTEKTHPGLAREFEEMASDILPGGNEETRGYKTLREIDLRPKGTDTYLTVEFTDFGETVGRFRRRYKGLFGFFPGDVPVEAVNLRLEVSEREEFIPPFASGFEEAVRDPKPASTRSIAYPEGEVSAPAYERRLLPPGFSVEGPAVVFDEYSSLVVDPGSTARVDERGLVVMDLHQGEGYAPKVPGVESAGPDPVLLEVFNNLFSSVASEMGFTLRNTAHSVNIKERLDFSCAVFDPSGDLVAAAQHIPVHLGAMADTVKALVSSHGGSMRPGDAYLTNNPYRGGSHLPDVTVVEPVFSDRGEITFYVAARGHHADMGGEVPGSIPAEAKHIEEEGVVVDGLLVLRDGVFMERELREALTRGPWPARNLKERFSDVKAQLAACKRGTRELLSITGRFGLDTVTRYMGFVQRNAEAAVKNALMGFLKEGDRFTSAFEDRLDDGTPIRSEFIVTAGKNPPETVRAVVDFSGTGGQHATDNLNAPLAVVRAAVIYVLRAITGAEIPLNGGCLKPVDIRVPEGSLLNPVWPAPVASGNVETSQRVVDVLLGALGVAGASQGTMNNLLFEAQGEPPYYETISGGAGATDGCPGASGVQVHMTNTRITDPEVLETRHPGVRLRRFSLRKGSGGEGEFPGGDGVVREITFLKPARVSIISERRSTQPYGARGGGPGLSGENILERADGSTVGLSHRASLEAASNETVIIKTPGGGGYGVKKP